MECIVGQTVQEKSKTIKMHLWLKKDSDKYWNVAEDGMWHMNIVVWSQSDGNNKLLKLNVFD